MSDSPTIDEFQRYLQDRLIEADNEVDANDKKDRIKTLEAAISELIEFRIEVSQRLDADIPVFQESEAVRLISSSTDGNVSKDALGTCPKCESEVDPDLGFCQACGHKS